MKIPELLSPAGDFECLKAAVQNGADSVYLGASSFNARAKATNFNNDILKEAIAYAKLRNVKILLTLNTLIKNNEFEEAVNLAIYAHNIGVDAIIVQDLGLAKYLLENYPEILLHASTQMTVHNLDGAKQFKELGFSRIVLARELSVNEIRKIKENSDIELEVFVHGALCISYSGQCLFSSMVGGRSGNRGLCAQPCRLQYDLCSTNNKFDSGYLLSPRDLCSIQYLSELIKAGVDSFKIEGRMKSPEYVGIVTQIYRKYIDLVVKNIELDNTELHKLIDAELNKVDDITSLTDMNKLIQVFNRGAFSSGHLSEKSNNNLIFKEKSNNMGIYLGEVFNFNCNKGHIKLELHDTISVGDRVSINSELYNVSELMIDNKNFTSLDKGNRVTIGRMKGKIFNRDKIYKLSDIRLTDYIAPSFKENKNLKKVLINGEITVKRTQPISLKVWSTDGFYNGLEYVATSTITAEDAINRPVTKESIIEQISKTGNTEFEFKYIDVILDDNLFLPNKSILNDLRRTALSGLENLVIKNNTYELVNVSIPDLESVSENNTDKNVSLLLNILDLETDYSDLSIDKLYVPLKYWINSNYSSKLSELTKNFNTYVYMPNIMKSLDVNFDNITEKFDIKGFVVSHISQIEVLKKYTDNPSKKNNLELIGNYSLNIYNNHSINELNKLGINIFTVSTELDRNEINNILNYSKLKSELIVYGKTPLMTNSYCYLGKSNKCSKDCNKQCNSNEKFYLKDRLGFNFRIVPDNILGTTTIYNSKITSVNYSDFKVNNIRIDILDENLEDIQSIISTVKSGNRFEGKEYTNGRL